MQPHGLAPKETKYTDRADDRKPFTDTVKGARKEMAVTPDLYKGAGPYPDPCEGRCGGATASLLHQSRSDCFSPSFLGA